MYKIIKVTNNVNDNVYYQVDLQVPFLFLWTKWKTKNNRIYDHKEDKDFASYMSVLLWIRNDMLNKKFKESRAVDCTLSSLQDVDDAINKILSQQRAERARIDAMSEAEYYNQNKTSAQDEPTN